MRRGRVERWVRMVIRRGDVAIVRVVGWNMFSGCRVRLIAFGSRFSMYEKFVCVSIAVIICWRIVSCSSSYGTLICYALTKDDSVNLGRAVWECAAMCNLQLSTKIWAWST